MTGFEWAQVIILGAAIAAVLSIEYYIRKLKISPLPTQKQVRRIMLEQIPGNIKGPVYELGAGWGGLSFTIARRYPDCQVIAFEKAFLPYLFLKCRRLLSPRNNLKIQRINFINETLGDPEVIICYLSHWHMKALSEKNIFPDDKDNDKTYPLTLISNTFALPYTEPDEIISTNQTLQNKVFVYRWRKES